MLRRGDDQPTVFSEKAASAEPPSKQYAPSPDALPPGIARRTGIVFVHGIGTQAPGETFLDWSGPIVELLTDWRAAEAGPLPPDPDKDRIDDPVWRSEFTFTAGSPPYLEIAVPAHAGIPATTWVVTEAWWASVLRAPSLGQTIHYLRRRMRTVVKGIADGYRDRSPRLAELAQATELIGVPPPLDWRLAERLDGRVLLSVEAVGKNLLLRFEGGVVLRSHLRMTGGGRLPIQRLINLILLPVAGSRETMSTMSTAGALLSSAPGCLMAAGGPSAAGSGDPATTHPSFRAPGRSP